MKKRLLGFPRTQLLAALTCATALAAVRCDSSSPIDSSGTPDAGTPDGGSGNGGSAPIVPFEPVAPASYVAKVKNLLTGLPPTAEEVQKVVVNPEALGDLIDQWIETPEAQAKLITFFSNAFQQTQFLPDDFGDQIGNSGESPDLIVPALREAMGRTALEMANQGRPFSETATTHTFMMTTALMSFYSFIDVRRRDDKGNDKDKMHTADPTWQWTAVDESVKSIPLSETLDPASPNYLVWSVPNSKCMPRVYTKYQSTSQHLLILLSGTLPVGTAPAGCNQTAIRNLPPFYTASDLSDWRMVTIRTPKAGEENPRFFDLITLRKASELIIDLPRVGFFTTPAFFANWPTNVNNLARVTTNQSLIVATGRSMNPESATIPLNESGLDEEHASPSSACYGCHQALDPMRQFFRRNLTVNYHEQLDPVEMASKPSFAFYGVKGAGTTLDDFAALLAKHPLLPVAWAQKLCTYADSAACSEDDPEFQRVVAAFVADGMRWKTLVHELFSSPLVTGAARTRTFEDREVVVSISRYDHLCTALTNRLGLDACNLPNAAKASTTSLAGRLSSNLPSDGYSRGSERPDLISAPGLFVRSTTENLCKLIAEETVDAKVGGKYKSTDKDTAIDDFVGNLMGLTSVDARTAGARTILQEHYASVVAAGGTPTQALRSTFILTCTSPLVTGIGL
jgi:hypothetical protein